MSVTHFFKDASAVKSRFRRSSDLRASRSALVIPLGSMDQVYLLHNFANCSLTGNGDLSKLADFFLILKCLKHADSSVICVFFVCSMDLQHRICQRLILPWLLFAFQIIIGQYRTKSVWRLCTPSACKFPAIFHKNAREYIKYSRAFFFI